jgi:23S rRNA (cytidine1920-2'-O)/16S rRNA (cytidine1409-2'-O)-methyltransferase
MAASKTRLDALMVARGLAETRDWAQRLIRAGEVRVGGQVVDTPAKLIAADADIAVANPPKYVSRGGLKLEAALDAFGVDPAGLTCADVGSSTGGFTDCLLQRGARRVYAVDAGRHQLHWKLRQDARVAVMEQVNARYLEALPEPVQLAVADVSFISLTLILPRIFAWIGPALPFSVPPPAGAERLPEGRVIALIKPQFEAGRDRVGRGGIVRDPAVHREVVDYISAFCSEQGWPPCGLIESPIQGTDGNKEFLVVLQREKRD